MTVTGTRFIVNPGGLGEKLKESFDQVRSRAQEFRWRVTMSSLEMQMESIQLQRSSRDNQDAMLHDLDRILTLTSSIYQRLDRVKLQELFGSVLQDTLGQMITDKGL